jgi:transposase
MAKPLSLDLRQRVVAAFLGGKESRAAIARRFGVHLNTVYRLIHLYEQTGRVAPRPRGGGNPASFSGEKLQRLRQLVARNPDATLEELRDLSGVSCTVATVFNTLKRLKLPLKKSRNVRPSKTAPTCNSSDERGDK